MVKDLSCYGVSEAADGNELITVRSSDKYIAAAFICSAVIILIAVRWAEFLM